MLLFVDRPRLAAAVVAAVRAHAVRRLRLVAVRALAEADRPSARRASGAWPSASWNVVVLDSASFSMSSLVDGFSQCPSAFERSKPRIFPVALAGARPAVQVRAAHAGTSPRHVLAAQAASSAATDRTARASADRDRSRRSRRTRSSSRLRRSRARPRPRSAALRLVAQIERRIDRPRETAPGSGCTAARASSATRPARRNCVLVLVDVEGQRHRRRRPRNVVVVRAERLGA